MLDLIREHQLNIMLVLIGGCIIASIFSFSATALSKRRRTVLFQLEVFSAILLAADRYAYIYRGDTSDLGYWMVRISNFLVFFMTLLIVHAFNLYLSDLLKTNCGLRKAPKSIIFVEILITVGGIILLISQYFDLIYYFDEFNRYQRGKCYLAGYITPLIATVVQIVTIVVYGRKLKPKIFALLFLFPVLSVISAFVQLKVYGISLTNITMVGISILLFLFAVVETNEKVERANRIEIDYLKEEQKALHRLFGQTVTALVNAIDSKDKYTHGHSSRVAEYSRAIAELSGMSEEDCERVYYSALLHDVGKIGIPDEIINKDGRLTDEEYEIIKQHPVIGEQILSSITEYPYLSIAAHHHHERYDGRGYPDKLKGEDIPEYARIVAVADAYDAMTSMRSYRDAIPQQKVREEIIKCAGTQFDPKYAKYMQHLIDLDSEYQMREKSEVKELGGKSELRCGDYRDNISEGIYITEKTVKMRLRNSALSLNSEEKGLPSFILFDSLDGRFHADEKMAKELNYFEYGEIRFDGTTVTSGARLIKTEVHKGNHNKNTHNMNSFNKLTGILGKNSDEYIVEAVRYKDHALIKITDSEQSLSITIALPDGTRYLYLGLTGEKCIISDVSIETTDSIANKMTIPRIAEEVSFIKGEPEGDVPNVQIDGYRTESTSGIPLKGEFEINFHTKCLPTARLVWHCPYIVIYSSDDKKIGGKNYHEYALIRLDGENWDSEDESENVIIVDKQDGFEGWDMWKEANREGMDININIKQEGNVITTVTENAGIYIKNITTLTSDKQKIYVALTGDQCALTNIKINNHIGESV